MRSGDFGRLCRVRRAARRRTHVGVRRNGKIPTFDVGTDGLYPPVSVLVRCGGDSRLKGTLVPQPP